MYSLLKARINLMRALGYNKDKGSNCYHRVWVRGEHRYRVEFDLDDLICYDHIPLVIAARKAEFRAVRHIISTIKYEEEPVQ